MRSEDPNPQSDKTTPPAREKPTIAPVDQATELREAQTRFKKCRFFAEDSGQEYCSNQDVLPYAGKRGFSPEAWCPDCTLYKLRRTVKKRPRLEDDDYAY